MPDIRKNVLLVAHDRGGVNLLVPLLSHWRHHSNIDATFIGTPMIEYEVATMMGAANQSAGSAPIHAIKVKESGTDFVGRSAWTYSDADLLAVLNNKPWDLVLTGTSLLSGLEKSVWDLCRQNRIPCAAICDMWTEYRRRFTNDGKLVLPELLLVLDERMELEVRAEFGSVVRTKIVGSPHFAHLIRSRQNSDTTRSKIRFISEPIAELFPAAGAHEFQIAEMLIGAVQRLDRTEPLVLRPHPQDDSEGWRRFVYNYRDSNVHLDHEPSWACPLSTKMAIGMSSMMLIELAMAGVPVASFQPVGSDKSFYCLQEDEFGIRIVENFENLVDWLAAPQQPQISPKFVAHHQQSIERITNLILSAELSEAMASAR